MTREEKAITQLQRWKAYMDSLDADEDERLTMESLDAAIEALQERKTAMWMPDEISCTGFICSNPDCWKKEFRTLPYCPNCGARMEGEGDETD